MNRSRFGLGLLLALLLLGIVSARAMAAALDPMAEEMEQAGAAAFREDWEKAEEISGRVKREWEKRFPFFASLSDHEPMENINGLFAQLEVYGQSRDHRNFAAVCLRIAEDLKAMGEAHSLKWWNLL